MGKGMKILIVVVSILVGCAVYNYFTKSNKKTEYTMTVSEIEAVVAVNFNDLMLCKGYAMQGRKKRLVIVGWQITKKQKKVLDTTLR